jgi:hypothetical protein
MQLAGLCATRSKRYSGAGLAKARAYLADPQLRQRLEAVIGVPVWGVRASVLAARDP